MSNLVFNASLVGDWFYNLWISLWLLIDNIVYVCINWMYRVFILVSKVDIFGGTGEIEKIVERLYLIVGIAMLFIFAYNLILLIINPEGNQLGNMGKVIQNALISIVLVTLLPLIFSYMSTIQSHIIDSNVIGHIILGTSNDPDADPDNKKAGVDTALTIFSAFYHPKDETLYSCKNGGTAAMCSKYISVYDNAYNNDDITSFVWDPDLKDGLKKDEMEYTYFLSSAAGIFALWMFISFGLDIGIRVGKLAFYQLISPIPVMMRILPNDKMFGKWFSGLKDTYISLFVRLAVIYFCMYAITLVPDVLSGMWATSGDNVIILALANVLVILGILKFAQEAPKLIGDLFGGSGNLSFGIAKKITDNKLAMAGMGGIGAGFGGMTGNAWNSWKTMGKGKGFKHNAGALLGGISSGVGGFFGGARRGMTNGYKSNTFKGLGEGITQGKQDAYVARDKRDDRQARNKDAGKIGGKTVPIVSGAWGGLKRGVKGAWDDSLEWMAGEEGYSPRAEAVARAKSTNAALKSDTYSKGKGFVSAEALASMKEALRRGERVEYGGHYYEGVDAPGIEAAIESLAKKVKEDNKNVRVQNYKDKAYVLESHLENLRNEINNGRAVYGADIEEILTKKINDAISKSTGDVKTALQGLVVGGNVQFDKVDAFLKKDKAQLEASTDAERRALVEFSDAFDDTMKLASERNVADKKDK